MVKRYTAWDVVADAGESVFVRESDYAALQAERDGLREDGEALFKGMEEARKERKAAQDEADRLREALEACNALCRAIDAVRKDLGTQYPALSEAYIVASTELYQLARKAKEG